MRVSKEILKYAKVLSSEDSRRQIAASFNLKEALAKANELVYQEDISFLSSSSLFLLERGEYNVFDIRRLNQGNLERTFSQLEVQIGLFSSNTSETYDIYIQQVNTDIGSGKLLCIVPIEKNK